MAVTNPIALMSGGSITDSLKNIAPQASSRSGDSSSGPVDNKQTFGFAQSSPFAVGRGARAEGDASSSPSGANSALIYVAIALAIGAALYAVNRK